MSVSTLQKFLICLMSSVFQIRNIFRHPDQGVRMVCQHGNGEIRGLLAVACPADNCPVPVPENPQTDPAGVINLIEANGHTVAGHILQPSAEVADGVGSTGLRCDGQHPGLEGLKFLTGQTGVRLIEGQVSRNSFCVT